MTSRIRLENVTKLFTRPRHGAESTLLAALRGETRGDKTELIHALDGITLTIEEGERVGIIGPNGAGKSTLLHLLAGTAEPSSGSIAIEGQVHAVLTIGAVLRDQATGRENVYLDGEIQGRTVAEIDALVGDVAVFSELGEFFDRPVRTYSSGMKARLAFAMLAHIKPEILIIDEVLSVGDVHFSRKATERMRRLTDNGRIVIVVSHGMQGIVEMCTRCIWIENGRVVMDGDPREVTNAYLAKVRNTDHEAMLRKFGTSRSLPGEAGREIECLEILQDGQPAVALMAKRDCEFRLTGEGSALTRPSLLLRIVRLDGSLIAEQSLPNEYCDRLHGRFDIRIELKPFTLGANLYRAEVVLCEGAEPVASSFAIFEVKITEPLIGGVPMLFHPCRVEVAHSDKTLSIS